MASDDLRLQLVIQAILDAKGFDEAKVSLGGLAASANSAAPAAKGLADATGEMAVKQEVSSREIKILTREILASIGASQGAGAAGRLAAVGFAAMGNAALGVNLALTATGFLIAFLLPRLMEWISTTGDNTESHNELLDSLVAINDVIKSMPEHIEKLTFMQKQWIADLHGAALDKEREKVKKWQEELDGLLARQGTDRQGIIERVRRQQELSASIHLTNEALAQGMTLDESRHKMEQEAAKDTKDRTKAEKEAADAAIKHMDFFAEQEATRNRIYLQRKEEENNALDLRQKQAKDATKDMASATLFTKKQLEDRAKGQDAYTKEVLKDNRELMEDDEKLLKFRAWVAQSTIGYIGQALGALSSAFGKNKALAIAGAIADTWAGAARALGPEGPPWPVNIAAAASVAAIGLADVVNIEKASPGFDDPMNDIIAEKLGRKSASDFVRLFGGGFHDGLRAANTGGGSVVNTTINRGVSIQSLHMSGILGVNEQDVMKNLNRKLISAQRLETRTTLGRS